MMGIKQDKVELSEMVLMRRVNRFLEDHGKKIRKNHPPRSKKVKRTERQESLGRFYIVSGKNVVERHVDLEAFARKHEILASYEVCARE
jgi:hypothetical protein